MSGILNTAGLFSGQGIDVTSVVQQLVTAASAPEQAWQTQQQTLQTQANAMSELNSELSALQTSVQALQDPAGALGSVTTTSSDPNLATISASPGSASGNHTLVVNNLATTSSYYTASVASSSTTLSDGSFTLQVGTGSPTTITIDDTDNTLAGLAANINGMNLGATANVITDANGARLSLVSQTSGAANDLTVSADSSGLGFRKATTGTNASLTVDGVPVSSTTNTVSGVVPGVTFNLTGSDPDTPVTVGVAADPSSVVTAVNNFVTAYNAAISDLNSQFTYNAGTQTSGPLAGDSSARIVQEQLLGFASYTVSGAGSLSTLQDLGISMNDDGTLSVDSSALSNAVSSNFQDVQSFFQGASGFATYLNTQLTPLTDPTQGAVYLDLKGAQATYQGLQDQINDFQTYIASEQQQWTAQYDQINVILQEFPLLQQQTDAQVGLPLQSGSNSLA
jgi:flagellar hook-associated protein 2